MRVILLVFLIILGMKSYAQSPSASDSLLQVVESQKGYPQKMELLQNHIGEIYTTAFDETIRLSQFGYALARVQNDSLNMGDFLRLIGLSYGKKGNIDSASHYYYQALKILEPTGDVKKLGLLYDDLARMYRKLRQAERALDFYDRALQLYQKANDLEGIARIYNESGVVYRDEGQYQIANERFEKSLQLQRQRGDSVGIGYSLEFLGYNQLLIKNYPLAESYLKQALAVRQKLNDAFALMLNYTALGEFYKETQQYSVSNQYFTESNTIAQRIGFLDIQQYNYEQIMTNHEALNNYEGAYRSLKKFKSIYDSLYNAQKLKDVEELAAKYETEKKEVQIKNQQLLLEREKKEKYLYITILAIGLLLLGSVVLGIINRNRHRTKLLLQEQKELALQKVMEAEEKERSRIAKDLHDGVVQELTALKHQLSSFAQVNETADFQSLEQQASAVANEVRNIAYQMMPLTLKEFGLEKALETLFERVLPNQSISFDLTVRGLESRLAEPIETHVYRICQELLQNASKHSKADYVSLLVSQKDHRLTIRFEDNGIGFNPINVQKGIGLNSLQSRIDLLKASLTFESGQAKGTIIHISVPV
ncbi:sensor histidine kinase [Cytophagales bacterium LB-30]|uniref:histidine kinase n=1 Tax=Shiella aurantiaca TaxID=3058365 RepID=A0ABT8F6W0_9BACT|nr:sensor histidine kinase [Shiella aurantiaca]MDN4166207.1 sensor histidine kinase [Shiella aurantiaca]